MTTMYGIKNCDTIKKAKIWLETNHIDVEFHDYRQQGLDEALLSKLCDALGWQTLLNTRGTTWRTIAAERKVDIDYHSALTLMLEHPALIKRPVIYHNGNYLCGFTGDSYANFFQISV